MVCWKFALNSCVLSLGSLCHLGHTPTSLRRSIFPFIHYLHAEVSPWWQTVSCSACVLGRTALRSVQQPPQHPNRQHSQKLSALGLFSHFSLLLAQHLSPKETWKLALDSAWLLYMSVVTAQLLQIFLNCFY